MKIISYLYYINIEFAGNWAQGLKRLKLFFVLVFYSILTTMYAIHFAETVSEFSRTHKSVTVTKQTNQKKEVTMKSEQKVKVTRANRTKTKHQSNHLENH